MKQVMQHRRTGRTQVVDVPAPLAMPGGVLVQNSWSLISAGTDRLTLGSGGLNLVGTARQRPDLVMQVLDMARREGVGNTLDTIRETLDASIPLGYSCAGLVTEVGSGVAEFRIGDRVACAGAGHANHAEFVSVPTNLTVGVPDAVTLEDASFVTLGAIALQGIRIANVRVGESCLVIGLGLVGQLTVQLLKAAGCRVFGIDVAPDKVDLALNLGADAACIRSDAELIQRVKEFTNDRGVDAVLITAGTSSSDPVQMAPSVARDRAVVVAVGMIGMDVPRNAYYEKELQLRLSRSYGPGRYDPSYERRGIDYPIGYVRWTERRNMEGFLQLVAEAKVRPSQLVTHRIPVREADRAYAILTGVQKEPYLAILLQYAPNSNPATRLSVTTSPPPAKERSSIRLGVVGAGGFAKAVLLPRLKGLGDEVQWTIVATSSGPSARQTAARFGFEFATSDWHDIVDDPGVDAVLVATRHNLHAAVTAAALRKGKAVFLEKPMALDEESLDELLAAWHEADEPPFMVGFNRRFAPTVQRLKAWFSNRAGVPLVFNYRVNAGSVSPDSWVVDPLQGGGRLIGEVCHMVDLLLYLADAPVKRVYAEAQNSARHDSVILSVRLGDGSVGTITYASDGDSSLPKERLEVLGAGKAAVLDDFATLTLHEKGRAATTMRGGQDKGHSAELRAFVDAVLGKRPTPSSPEHAAHVTRVTFAAVKSLRLGLPIDCEDMR